MFVYFMEEFSHFHGGILSIYSDINKSEYIDKIPPWKWMKEVFSANFFIKNYYSLKSFFIFLKVRTKRNPDCPNKNLIQSMTTFIRLSEAIAEARNICINQ